eukprot:721344-Rhodomonas_salina.1
MPWASSSARCSSYSSLRSSFCAFGPLRHAPPGSMECVCAACCRGGGRRDDGFQQWSGKDRVQGEEDDGAVPVIERHGLGPVIDDGSDSIQPGHS